MKKILLVAAAMITLAPAARAAEIASIDCLASNGVVLKGAADEGQALQIDTQWGLYEERFVASLGASITADTTIVNLDSTTGDHYQIALDATAPRLSDLQTTSGTILQPSTVRGLQPSVVAYVRCDLRLR